MTVKDDLLKAVHPTCLPIAMISQTGFILSVTATTWTLMYFYSPSKSLRLRFPALNNTYIRVEHFIQKRVDSLPYSLRSSNKIDWNRVVTSGAEAWIIRKPLIPFTYSGSVAFGIFCGTRFYNLLYGEQPQHQHHHVNNNDIDINNNNNNNIHDNKEMVFGWNKIEHAPSTNNWDKGQYDNN